MGYFRYRNTGAKLPRKILNEDPEKNSPKKVMESYFTSDPATDVVGTSEGIRTIGPFGTSVMTYH